MNALFLVLTSGCNLKCGYCFQNDKQGARMDRDTMRRAIDLVLGASQPENQIVFSGGEPLLEFPLVRHGVAFAEAHCPPGKRIRYGLITNGTLFTDTIVDFLAEHEFELQVSFDGIPAASDVRARGSFRVLDRKLARIRERQPRFFSTITVASIVSPETVQHMSDSSAYFLRAGFRSVAFSPVFTDSTSWSDEGWKGLNEQFSRMCRLSVDHYRKTGEIPVSLFGGGGAHGPPTNRGETLEMCGAASGVCPSVGVDGRIHACATFVDTYQTLPSDFMRSRLDAIRLGDVRTGDFQKRLDALHDAAVATGLFHNKRKKYSSYGRCGECEYLHSCTVCPTSIGHIPGNNDPDRVPDFVCAFNMVANQYARKFALETGRTSPSVRSSSALDRIRAFADHVRSTS